jgi:RNase P subunit RPR2
MIIKREIKKIYEHRLYCDKCNIELVRDSIVLTSFPEQYSYTCPTCGKTTLSYNLYPEFEYVFEEDGIFPWSQKNPTDGG